MVKIFFLFKDPVCRSKRCKTRSKALHMMLLLLLLLLLLYVFILCRVHMKQLAQKHAFLSLANVAHQPCVVRAYGRCYLCSGAIDRESGSHCGYVCILSAKNIL